MKEQHVFSSRVFSSIINAIEMGVRTPHPSFKLQPPCKQGDHGPYIDSKGQTAVGPVGRYYSTEDALKHDLAALRRGDIYEWDDFYKRAKVWYKSEIDRLLHLEKVKQVSIHP